MAANILKFLLPMIEFLDTKIAPAIKPTSKNKMLTQSISLMAGTYSIYKYQYAHSDIHTQPITFAPLIYL